MKRILFILAFGLALFARAATPLAAEPIDTTGIPSNALVVFHADSKMSTITPGDFLKWKFTDKEGVLEAVSKRLGFDIAKDVATSTFVMLPPRIANTWNVPGVILRGNLPAEKILAAAKRGSNSAAVVRVGGRSVIKTFLLSGMGEIAEKLPALVVSIDDKTLLVVVDKDEIALQPFLAVFNGKAAKFAMPQGLDALCKQLAPVQGVFYCQELNVGISPDYLPDCNEIWAIQSDDSKTIRLRIRMMYGKAFADLAATERSTKEALIALPGFFNNNFKKTDATPSAEVAALHKQWAELNSAIKLTLSAKTISMDLDYPSADFLKIIEVFRRPPAEPHKQQ